MSEDQTEFIRMFTAVQPLLRRYVFSQIPNFHQAEDALQEIAVTLWTKLDRYDASRDFNRWALGVARYEILHTRRVAARQKLVFTDAMDDALVEHVESAQEEDETRRSALRRCRGKLSDKQRRILDLKYEQDASSETIAARMGLTINAARIHLHRIRQWLTDCVGKTLAVSEEAPA